METCHLTGQGGWAPVYFICCLPSTSLQIIPCPGALNCARPTLSPTPLDELPPTQDCMSQCLWVPAAHNTCFPERPSPL